MKNLFTLLSLAAVVVAANAQNDQSAKKSDRVAVRRTVVEEFTGTGCGYCPRGLVGMELLKEEYGDRFIGIGLHQYNSSDPMYIKPTTDYTSISFGGAPSCRIDRGSETDPYYGSGNSNRGVFTAFETANAKSAPVDVELTATWAEGTEFNGDTLKIDLTANVYAIESGKYKLEFVATADSICCPDNLESASKRNKWKQSNYYYQYSASQLGEDLAIFGNGGELGQSSFFWTFDDVALASSKNKSEQPGEMEVDQEFETSYTLALPVKDTYGLYSAICESKDKVYGIAIVVDAVSKKIANAIRVNVVDPNTVGIKTVDTEVSAAPVASYTLDGKQVAEGQKGFSVVRMSDGSVRKELRK